MMVEESKIETVETALESPQEAPGKPVDGQTAPEPTQTPIIKKKRKKVKKQIKYVSKMPVQRARSLVRIDYDEMNIQSFILDNRIRDIERIYICREMKPDKHGYYITSYTIIYIGEKD